MTDPTDATDPAVRRARMLALAEHHEALASRWRRLADLLEDVDAAPAPATDRPAPKSQLRLME